MCVVYYVQSHFSPLIHTAGRYNHRETGERGEREEEGSLDNPEVLVLGEIPKDDGKRKIT